MKHIALTLLSFACVSLHTMQRAKSLINPIRKHVVQSTRFTPFKQFNKFNSIRPFSNKVQIEFNPYECVVATGEKAIYDKDKKSWVELTSENIHLVKHNAGRMFLEDIKMYAYFSKDTKRYEVVAFKDIHKLKQNIGSFYLSDEKAVLFFDFDDGKYRKMSYDNWEYLRDRGPDPD